VTSPNLFSAKHHLSEKNVLLVKEKFFCNKKVFLANYQHAGSSW
jgi:hypothetical protein